MSFTSPHTLPTRSSSPSHQAGGSGEQAAAWCLAAVRGYITTFSKKILLKRQQKFNDVIQVHTVKLLQGHLKIKFKEPQPTTPLSLQAARQGISTYGGYEVLGESRHLLLFLEQQRHAHLQGSGTPQLQLLSRVDNQRNDQLGPPHSLFPHLGWGLLH